jgi:hypothetical protein
MTGAGGRGMRRRHWLPGRDDRGTAGVPRCINGYFTPGSIPGGSSPGGACLGAVVVRITG